VGPFQVEGWPELERVIVHSRTWVGLIYKETHSDLKNLTHGIAEERLRSITNALLVK